MIKPLTEHASRVNVTLTEPTLALLVRAKELMAGKSDDEIHRLALDALLDRIAPERRHARRIRRLEKLAAKAPQADEHPRSRQGKSPSKPSRRGKLADRDAATVDGDGQCTFVGPDGHRCTARSFIQTDHVIPVAKGGPSQYWNFAPLCATHNAFKGAKSPEELSSQIANFWS
jgi:5-methylcytosine-specific restriction endonuclease McrA